MCMSHPRVCCWFKGCFMGCLKDFFLFLSFSASDMIPLQIPQQMRRPQNHH